MKPNEATIVNLKQELQQALDTLINNNEVGLIDILPITRKYVANWPIGENHIEYEFDQIIQSIPESDIDYFHGGLPLLNVIYTMGIHNNIQKQYLENSEPDNIYVSYEQYHGDGNSELKINDELINVLAMIMLHDCTHCCNALKFINLSQYGLFSAGDISMTYHS